MLNGIVTNKTFLTFEEPDRGEFKGCTASIGLKEDKKTKHCDSRKCPIHTTPMGIA